MFHGRFVETGPGAALFAKPAHPYTRELIDAEPKLEEAPAAPAEPPPRPDASSGCVYAARCPYAQTRCVEEAPSLRPRADGRRVACHFPLGDDRAGRLKRPDLRSTPGRRRSSVTWPRSGLARERKSFADMGRNRRSR